MTRRKKLISILIPVFNEEENVERAYQAVVETMCGEGESYDFEIVFTDNHSDDGTFEKLKVLSARDTRVRAFRFSRNFGFQKSIYTGYMKARGDVAVQLDCDLQDPPSLISEFLRKHEQGYQVVYGIRRKRHENLALRTARRIFYWLLDKISEHSLPRGAGDFRLVDRRIIEELRKIKDTNIYIRGRIAALGFQQIGVPYDREPRRFGTSKFPLGKMVSLAVDGIVSHSILPLRLASIFGLSLLVPTSIAVLGYGGARLLTNVDWPGGFTTVVVLILIGTGLNGLFVGVIGEYLARMYEQLKLSPDVIIESELSGGESSEPCVPPAHGGAAASNAPATIRGPNGEKFVQVFASDQVLIYERADGAVRRLPADQATEFGKAPG